MPKPSKILIVDDDPQIYKLLSHSFSSQRYEITSAHDGFQALELIKAERFDILLLDLMLPGPGGIDILKHIHERQIGTKVIVLTAHASLESTIEALQLGAYDYVTKPFQIKALRSTVKRAVEKQRLETKLAAIHDLSREMTLSLDVNQVTEAVLDIVERVLEFDICGVSLIDEEQGDLYMLAGRGAEQDVPCRLPLNGERGITVAAARSGKTLYVPDVREDPRYVNVRATTRSELAAPLVAQNRVIGVLNIESAKVDAFSPGDAQLVSTLAAQAAIAIENARLFEQAQREIAEREHAEKEIKRRHQELTALNTISQAITSTLNQQEILTLIAESSIQLLDVEATSVLLYDENTDDLWFAAASGVGANRVIGQRLALGQGIAGWTAQHGEPALVTDVSDDPRVFKGFDQEGVFVIRSALCVPLRNKGQVIGVLEACNKISGIFTQEDMWLLSSLAAPAVTAIENARLFEQVRAGREQLQALSRRLVDVQEATLGRVARELHDETGQALSALLLSLSLLERNADDPVAVITRVNELEGLVDRTLENLHRLSMNLRPASLDHLGLVPALEHYVELFSAQHDLVAQFEAVGFGDERLPPAVETAFYRIVQEALTNVARHAQATRLDVLLERRGDKIVILIEDNGVGFDTEGAIKSGRLGLFGIRERAEMLGGALTIESAIGAGTTVLVEIPDVKRET
ncbi:MAG: GAF domain-containing protein [Chloroflexota bacterium]|nr:GAF domain-containing protein [Chloroflexota bacterium]